ncbi:hypothetical protein RP20_CCG001617 [Aedes albopictus]|nr:hypothetical protein RP20_CCG001617 [Aedes albopictus]
MKLSLAVLLPLFLASVVLSDDDANIDSIPDSSSQDLDAYESELGRIAVSSAEPAAAPAIQPHPQPSPPSSMHNTHWDTIPVGSPEAWYPMMLDVCIGYYTHWLRSYIRVNQIVKERLLYHRQLLSQIPPFFDGINLYYDGDHLHSILTRNAELESWAPSSSSSVGRNLNYTVPGPKVAMEVIDTVKAIMGGLQNVKN